MARIRAVVAAFFLTLLLSDAPTLLYAGDVEGTITLPPRTPQKVRAPRARYPGEKPAAAEEVLRGPAVLFLAGITTGAPFAPPKEKPILAQHGRQFVPLALPVLAGTIVRFPNEDDEYHNVFSRSEPKELELGRYGQGESKEITFEKPGLVRLHCEIHAHMHAVVLVLDNPFYSVADEKGHFVIKGAPAGKYKLYAFYEDLEPEEKTASGIPATGKDVEIPAEGKVSADFDLAQKK